MKIQKLSLPKQSKRYKLKWNDTPKHNFFDRIKRAGLKRKPTIQRILKGLDDLSSKPTHDGPYILSFKKEPEFYISVFVSGKTANIKTILSKNMFLRKTDVVLKINEFEEIFYFDLSEFYEDGFVNSYFGSVLIEESLDSKSLEVFIDEIQIER